MASAIAELIAGKLSELAVNEATLLWNFKDDVDGMRKTMEKMKARMLDADERSWSRHDGHQARLWTKEFKSAAYDVGDLLDMFEAIERIKKSQSKVLNV
ncbi:hypothetical protein PR202_ga11947 [Eleusine coracana subsp. coracana]|uniref:Disease resistance N-terminal domain-containing protein n=1 Tax=Eleusine coracana subsp. coracana TaxID=191504 RepID=A0AAV5CAR4_ELECO|nr:hypothetical protein QOZ80_5AG0396920 [Eleusine coracana subsp. coracana]GJM95235.1 hypothetical protein PR202_ga11947 [Eleusine coracana subsp. coracana]